jgi:Protein of unknown function (DUF3168)
MTIEELIYAALQDLAGGRVFPDVAPENTPVPYITYQAIGGDPLNFLGGDRPDKANTRMQLNVWAATRIEASTLGAQVEDAVRAAVDLQPEVLTGRTATYDETTQYRGTMQDFSLFH